MTDSRKKKRESNFGSRPRLGKGDVAHTAIKALMSAVPIVGGTAAEIFSAIVGPPIARRRDEWVESIVKELKKLQVKVNGLSVEALTKNDAFITTVMHASLAAIRNHQKEKLEALRNAVLNSALPTAPEEDLQLMFLNFVDDLTPWHLKVLEFCEDPQRAVQKKGVETNWSAIRPSAVLEFVFPEFRARRDFYDLIIRDLSVRGLIRMEGLDTLLNAQRALAPWTTRMGKEFIKFIESPFKGGNKS